MAIGENSNDALVEYVVQDRANLVEIELFAALILIKCIVKFELSILYLFCNTINLIPAIMYNNSGIGH